MLILLASYKGTEFLDQQLLSIRQQTYTDWHLLIHNDGADPETQTLVAQHAKQDCRIEWLVEDSPIRRGACGNFAYLLNQAQDRGHPYFALADQDDVWDCNKLERQMDTLRQRELTTGTATPMLLHTDLRVADTRLQTVFESFVKFRGFDPAPQLASLLTQNSVTGCSCVGNQALLGLALPVPESTAMHDWWLALCAASAGELLYLDEPTVSYRQHAGNAIGAFTVFQKFNLVSALHVKALRARQSFKASFAQAYALSSRLPSDSTAQITLTTYCKLLTVSRRERYRLYRQLMIKRAGRLAQCQFFCQLMFEPVATPT